MDLRSIHGIYPYFCGVKQFSISFWAISFSLLLFMTSFNLILPELNHFLLQLRGENYIGLIIAVFTVSAAISRPFSGKLADHIGRKKVIAVGLLICAVANLLYPFSHSIFFFFVIRFLHGFSAGFAPTGATALVTDLLPSDRRGFGMGIFGTFSSLGIGFGQSLSHLVISWTSINGMFMLASVIALLAYLLMFWVEETLEHPRAMSANYLRIQWSDVFEPPVLPSALVMYLTATCSGIVFTLSPEISDFLHLANKGHFFLFYVFSTILIRLLSGNLSDKIGRRQTMLIGVVVLTIAMLITGFAQTTTTYTLGSIIFGIATGITSPTLFAWTADLSQPDRRGVGAGTMFIAMETGIFTGSMMAGAFYDRTFSSISAGFVFGAICCSMAAAYLIYHLRFRTSNF